MHKKKIGIILNRYPVHSETFIQSFIEHLEEHKLILFTKKTRLFKKTHNVKVYPFLNHFPYYQDFHLWCFGLIKIFMSYNRALFLIKNGVPLKQLIADSHIWTQRNLDYLHFPFANLAFGREFYAECIGAKMTISFRGSDINVFPIIHQKTYKKIFQKVHKVHFNSMELLEAAFEYGFDRSYNYSVIHPALRKTLNQSFFSNQKHEPDIFKIVTIGRLHWVKDYPLAFRTMKKLKEQKINFQYHIYGSGSEKEHLTILRYQLDLEEEIFINEFASPTELSSALSSAQAYLQTSYAEGYSNSCMEAQVFGVPCIVPFISGMSDCIEQNRTGIIVQDRSENSFCEALLKIAKNQMNFDTELIQKRANDKFDLSKQKIKWLNFFN
jgi:colanic acid/amylovoran biosynthesis glycosyltransferase